MLNSKDAIKIALDKLEETESFVLLNEKEIKEKKFQRFSEVCAVKKLVSYPLGIGKELLLYLCFKSDFPFTIPSVYLSKESYDEIKYLPHIDHNFFICTFDSETVITNSEDPYGIVKETLEKARTIIEAGLAKTNTPDFIDEFQSYWENKYAIKDSFNKLLLSFIIEDPNTKPVTLLMLNKELRNYKYILYQDNEDANRFKAFMDECNVKYTEVGIFYINENIIPDSPPFHLTCKKTFGVISDLGKDVNARFKQFINSKIYPKVVLVRKELNGRVHYFGWIYPQPQLVKDGYRIGTITPYQALSTFQSAELVQRMSPVDYTNERMQKRSKGEVVVVGHKILVAGLGSIGSNLIYFLNALDYPEFRLVDYDFLTIENTERHLLGFDLVNAVKVDAIRNYLKATNPKQEVKVKNASIIDVCNSDINFINETDFLFIAIGKWNVEKFIIEKMKSGEITKPVFILWVEPYLAGGHCMYIHPDDIRYDEFYEDVDGWNLFKYNAIEKEEYIGGNKLLRMKEASCQTTYTPYSGSSTVAFLAQLYSQILKIISIKSKESVSITWLGDLDEIKGKGIKLSEFAEKNSSFQIIENKG